MGTLLQDIRYGFRMLARNPGFTIVVILVLGLGIGATTSVFSVVNGVLLRPLPYKDPGRLVMLFSTSKSWGRVPTSRLDFLDWKRQNRSFEDMAISRFTGATYRHEEGTESIEGMCVSPNLFGLLGLTAPLGRAFLPEETWPNHHYVILGHGFWRRRFGGDESVLGQTITLGIGEEEATYTVVGTMPPDVRFLNTGWSLYDFTEVNAQVDFWIPVDRDLPEKRGTCNWEVVARLKAGVHVKAAQTEMDAMATRLGREYYSDPAKARGVDVIPLYTHLVGETRPLARLGAGAGGFVLLIACANVANLLLAQGLARRREMAMRATLGAGRWPLLRQAVTESVLLGMLGGALGLLLAICGVGVFRAITPESIPRQGEVGIDLATLAFALGVALLTGISVGLVPALRTCRLDLNEALKEGTRGAMMGSGRCRLARLLVTAQVSLSLTLLIGSGLLINSLSRLLLLDPGYRTRNILTMKISNTGDEGYYGILRRAESLPGVRAAAVAFGLPLSGDNSSRGTTPPQELRSDIGRPQILGRIVTPGYFELMGIPLLAGRDFTEHDSQDSTPVVIVNERLARLFWPNEDPIGKRFKYDMADGMVQIVGVVGDVKSTGLDAEAELEAFLPRRQLPGMYQGMGARLLVAAETYPKVLIERLSKEIWSVDKNAVITEIQTMGEIVGETLAVRRFLTVVLSGFSSAALILAGFGIYGVVAHSVRQRTHEIGIRMALGASAGEVSKAVLAQGLKLTLIGVVFGLAGAVALTRTIAGFLYNVSSMDPLTFVCMSLFLAGTAALASYVPARRAARIDPMTALRYE